MGTRKIKVKLKDRGTSFKIQGILIRGEGTFTVSETKEVLGCIKGGLLERIPEKEKPSSSGSGDSGPGND